MKKFFKALALVLALALVIGVVPAQATSAKVKAKKTLYVDGAKGTSTDGTKTSGYKERVAIYKLAGAKKADKEDHTFRAKIKSGDSVTVSKNYVYAAGLGKSVVEIFKDGESLGQTVVTVKKNATDDTLTITEFEDGKEVVCGVEYTVTLPRKGVDSDERRLFVDDKAQTDKEDAPRAYAVKFTTAGDHKVKFEAFQSAELDKATASKEITVKAVMPKAVSAKQLSANSFAVTFEGDMTDLISDKDITNQMIYYMIADEPVVTGVIKEVKVEKTEVKITMYANFIGGETYFFKYGDSDAVSFKTALNGDKYVKTVKLVQNDAYYVGENNKITCKLYNDEGVEIAADSAPVFEVESENGWLEGTNEVYFFQEGPATIKVTFFTGLYDPDTYEAVVATDSISVTGTTRAQATATKQEYTFGGAVADQLRVDGVGHLKATYKDSDGNTFTIGSAGCTYVIDGTDFKLQSTDETRAMITDKNDITALSEGPVTIVLYKKNADATYSVYDAFSLKVLGKNHAASATATPSMTTFNLDGAVDQQTNKPVKVTVKATDLDGKAFDLSKTKITIAQVKNNDTASGITVGTEIVPGTAQVITDYVCAADTKSQDIILTFTGTPKTEVVTTAVTVKVVDTQTSATICNQTLNIYVAKIAEDPTKDTYKIRATVASLDNSAKRYDELPDLSSEITVDKVRVKGSNEFYIGKCTDWKFIDKQSNIPTTGTAAQTYVIRTYPSGVAHDGTYVIEDATTNHNITINSMVPGTDARAKKGTYTFTGFHVTYDGTSNKKNAQSSIGSVQVLISNNDVVPTATIIDGKATSFQALLGGTKVVTDLFDIAWDGKDTDIVVTAPAAADYKKDDTSTAYYVYNLPYTVTLYDPTPATNNDGDEYKVTGKIKVNKLFKDEK
jgi:hypothetical protein